MARRARRHIYSIPAILACFASSTRSTRAPPRSGPCPEERPSPRTSITFASASPSSTAGRRARRIRGPAPTRTPVGSARQLPTISGELCATVSATKPTNGGNSSPRARVGRHERCRRSLHRCSHGLSRRGHQANPYGAESGLVEAAPMSGVVPADDLVVVAK